MKLELTISGLGTAYLDHNVLDHIIKGYNKVTVPWLKENNLIPVYSYATLNEIKQSVGYETKFLDLLTDLNALYLDIPLDNQQQPTNKVKIIDDKPHDIYVRHLKALQDVPEEFGASVQTLFEKFSGGHEDLSYEDISNLAGCDFESIGSFIDKELSELDDLPEELEHLKGISFKEHLSGQHGFLPPEAVKALDAMKSSPMNEFNESTGVSPGYLSSGAIKPPNVLLMIIEYFKEKHKEMYEGNPEDYVPFDPSPIFGFDNWQDKTKSQKIDAIYHGLNFIGYFRDQKMKLPTKANAFLNDMTHAGYASHCGVLVTSDTRMAKKAEAAYDFVKCGTAIAFFNPK
ncbi:MAG TPA: hypothetical protein VIM93_00445 [Kangiella sp.]